jgi:hypothetical protein
MERFNALGRGAQMMLVGSVLLLIDTFFHWQEVSISFLGTSASSGINAWHGFWGVAMGLLTIVLIAWLVARLAAVNVPIPPSLTGAVLAFLIFAFALIKNLADDYSTFWSWVGVGLAALIAVGGWFQIQESGGVENLRSEATSITGSGGGAGAAAAGGSAAAAGGMTDTAGDAAGAAGGMAGDAAQAAEGAASGAMDMAGDAASPAADAAGSAADAAGSAESGAMDAASEAVPGSADAAGGAMDAAEGAMGDTADAASEAADDLTGGPSTAGGA